MIAYKKNAVLTIVVVIVLMIKAAIMYGSSPTIVGFIDNYVTVFIIFAMLDMIMYAYLTKRGRLNDE